MRITRSHPIGDDNNDNLINLLNGFQDIPISKVGELFNETDLFLDANGEPTDRFLEALKSVEIQANDTSGDMQGRNRVTINKEDDRRHNAVYGSTTSRPTYDGADLLNTSSFFTNQRRYTSQQSDNDSMSISSRIPFQSDPSILSRPNVQRALAHEMNDSRSGHSHHGHLDNSDPVVSISSSKSRKADVSVASRNGHFTNIEIAELQSESGAGHTDIYAAQALRARTREKVKTVESRDKKRVEVPSRKLTEERQQQQQQYISTRSSQKSKSQGVSPSAATNESTSSAIHQQQGRVKSHNQHSLLSTNINELARSHRGAKSGSTATGTSVSAVSVSAGAAVNDRDGDTFGTSNNTNHNNIEAELEAKMKTLDLRVKGQIKTIRELEAQLADSMKALSERDVQLNLVNSRLRAMASEQKDRERILRSARNNADRDWLLHMEEAAEKYKSQAESLTVRLGEEQVRRQRAESRAKDLIEHAHRAKTQYNEEAGRSADLQAALDDTQNKLTRARREAREAVSDVSALKNAGAEKDAEIARQKHRTELAEAALRSANNECESLKAELREQRALHAALMVRARAAELAVETARERDAARVAAASSLPAKSLGDRRRTPGHVTKGTDGSGFDDSDVDGWSSSYDVHRGRVSGSGVGHTRVSQSRMSIDSAEDALLDAAIVKENSRFFTHKVTAAPNNNNSSHDASGASTLARGVGHRAREAKFNSQPRDASFVRPRGYDSWDDIDQQQRERIRLASSVGVSRQTAIGFGIVDRHTPHGRPPRPTSADAAYPSSRRSSSLAGYGAADNPPPRRRPPLPSSSVLKNIASIKRDVKHCDDVSEGTADVSASEAENFNVRGSNDSFSSRSLLGMLQNTSSATSARGEGVLTGGKVPGENTRREQHTPVNDLSTNNADTDTNKASSTTAVRASSKLRYDKLQRMFEKVTGVSSDND